MIEPYKAGELMRMAIKLGGPEPREPLRSLATYADESNWKTINAKDENGEYRCYWTWKGPVIVGYELAESTLKENEKNKHSIPYAHLTPDDMIDLANIILKKSPVGRHTHFLDACAIADDVADHLGFTYVKEV